MTVSDVQQKILEKIDIELEFITKTTDGNSDNKISNIILNLTNAYKNLNVKNESEEK